MDCLSTSFADFRYWGLVRLIDFATAVLRYGFGYSWAGHINTSDASALIGLCIAEKEQS